MLMYEDNANVYDLINQGIPYEKEAQMLTNLLLRCEGNSLLDVACGTGKLISFIDSSHYKITGIDYSKGMLEIAKKKNSSSIDFLQGDMRKFNLDSTFSVVSCLGSAIQYNLSIDDLKDTIVTFYNHSSGYVIFDVRYCIDKWVDGYIKDQWYENEIYIIHETWISNRIGVYSIWEPKFEITNKISNEKKVYVDYHKIRLFSCKEIEEVLSSLHLNFNIVDVNLNECTNVKECHFYYLINNSKKGTM